MNVSKKRIIMKSFIESQFGYCPLIWMLHIRGLNNKINRIHERALRITYNDKSSSYSELLTKDRSVTIHHRNKSFGSRNLQSHTGHFSTTFK